MTVDLSRLSFSTIKTISDVNFAQDLIDQLTVHIEHMKAQLEFGSEDETVDWEKRTLFALANKKALRSALLRQRDGLTFTEKRASDQQSIIDGLRLKLAEAKSERVAENQRHNLETQRLAYEREAAKNHRLLQVDTYFRQCAKRFMTIDQVKECEREAELMAAGFSARRELEGAAQ